MATHITASMLYNLVQCPHRVDLDLRGNPADKDEVSTFVQLLWEQGNALEREVMETLTIPFTDLSPYVEQEKERQTMAAIRRGDELVYSGRMTADDLVGEPDLLRKKERGYVAGDIKSGAGEEGGSDTEEGKPKIHYAMQLALYTDILEKLQLSAGHRPFVWDVNGDEIAYDLDAPQGVRTPRTLWSIYQDVLAQARSISSMGGKTLPAFSSTCKLCHWRSTCMKALEEKNDLTLIPELGRARRDAMLPHVADIPELARMDIGPLIKGRKTVIPRIGPDTLKKFQVRAKLLVRPNARPFLKERVDLPCRDLEIFFDVETDPMRDLCYLHGFVERKKLDNSTEKYVSFFATEPTPEHEKQSFAQAWKYIKDCRPCGIYYYSKYERTTWRKLRERHPDVATEEEIEALFSPEVSTDLYHDIVRPKTEWPTHDYSIKSLASYLGFSWRDTDPSGASSVEWYHRWVESKDESVRQRILEYNEDDCIATRVLLDGLRGLKRQT